MLMSQSLLKHCRPRTQINNFMISSSHATRCCSVQLRWYCSKKNSLYLTSMVLPKLFTKRCVLLSNNAAEFSSLSSVSSFNFSLSRGISDDDDKFLSSYPSSYLKRSYPIGQMMLKRTFATAKRPAIWTPELTYELIALAVKFNQNGYIDWVNIANEIGHGLTNVQCKNPSYSYDADVVKAFSTQPKKKLYTKNVFWSTIMDDRLEQGVKRFGYDWVLVAGYVGSKVSNDRCRNRWNKHFKPKIDGLREGMWTLMEYHQLKDLVLVDSAMSNLTGTAAFRPSIDWTSISGKMKRSYKSCQNKWETIYNQRWKKLNPHFTQEEDEFLIQSVIEAYKNTSTDKLCFGGWVTLGKKINRDPESVRRRFKKILSKNERVILVLENIEKNK